jgi:hypothetical protein
MRAAFLLILLALAGGCASPQPTVAIATDNDDGWLAPEDLNRIVQDFAADQKLDFDFRGLTPHIVIPHSRDYLAEVWYGKGMGYPTLMTKIGFDRRVIEHNVGVGVCGTGLNNPGKIEELLEKVPPWADLLVNDTDGRGESMRLLNQINDYRLPEIEEGVRRYCAKVAPTDVRALSTIYVLNRFLFNVPDVLRPDQFLAFGGWGDIPKVDGGFSGIWPLSRDKNYRFVLTGQIHLYTGAPYDALGEFAYFKQHYGRR